MLRRCNCPVRTKMLCSKTSRLMKVDLTLTQDQLIQLNHLQQKTRNNRPVKKRAAMKITIEESPIRTFHQIRRTILASHLQGNWECNQVRIGGRLTSFISHLIIAQKMIIKSKRKVPKQFNHYLWVKQVIITLLASLRTKWLHLLV